MNPWHQRKKCLKRELGLIHSKADRAKRNRSGSLLTSETQCFWGFSFIYRILLKAKGMKEDIESTVNQYVDSVVNSEMKKEFMRYATLENPKTTLGKIVSKAFKTFKEWWDKTKKPEIAEEAKTSILQKLRESQAIVDQRKEQQSTNLNRNNIRPER